MRIPIHVNAQLAESCCRPLTTVDQLIAEPLPQGLSAGNGNCRLVAEAATRAPSGRIGAGLVVRVLMVVKAAIVSGQTPKNESR